MIITRYTQSPLLFSCQTARFGGRHYLAVTASLGFNLDGVPGLLSGGDALGAAGKSLEPLAGQGVVFDAGLPKPRGEFFAAGAAYPPPGEQARTSAAVSLRLGPLLREFLAVGEAPLLGPGPGEPAPFRSVPLDWERTARSAANPRGQAPGETLTAYGTPLGFPQVTDMLDTGGALSAAWPPAACPLPQPYGSSLAGSGTYDRAWLLDCWPGFPADFDMECLLSAQGPQRLPSGTFRGDEGFAVRGMHPLRAELKGALPGIAPRVIAGRIPPGMAPPEPPAPPTGPAAAPLPPAGPPEGLEFAEVAMDLDTVWLFPLFGAGVMIWHGSLALADPLAEEVWGLAGALFPLGDRSAPPAGIFAQGAAGFPEAPVVLPFQEPAEPRPAAPAAAPPPAPAAAAAAPEAPFFPAPAAAAVAAPPPAPPLSSGSILDETRQSLADDLPEINKALAEQGMPPVTAADLDRSLERYRDGLGRSLGILEQDSRAQKALASLGPAELAAHDEAAFVSDLARAGLGPEEAKGLFKAVNLPVPLKSQFKTAGEFEAAIREYGSRFAKLTGMSEEAGLAHARKMRAASLLEENPAAGVSAVLEQAFGKEQAAGIAAKLAAPPAPAPAGDSPAAVAAALASSGMFSRREAEALAKGLAGFDSLAPGAGMKEIAAALQACEAKIAGGLGPEAAGFAARIGAGFQLAKGAFWKDPELGAGLEAAALRHPEIKAALPELNRLRLEASEPFGSLSEMARSAGIASPAALAEIHAMDPWVGKAPPESRPAPEPEAAPGGSPEAASGGGPEGGPPEPEETPAPAALTSRAQAEELLARARQGGQDAAILSGKAMIGLPLAGLDFSGLDLRGARLTGSDLTGAAFRGSDLSKAAMDGCRAGGADFAGASLAGADLSRLEGADVNLAGASLAGADFTGADLSQARLAGASAPGAVFSAARIPKDLKGANLSGATLSRWNGEGADLSGADLSGASLSNVNFASANLSGANLERASFFACDLSRADFRSARLVRAGLFLHTRAPSADFRGADLSGAAFNIAEASGADFSGSLGGRACFSGVRLRGASFQGGSFREAVFHGADLTGSDFFGADLMRCVFGGARLAGAVFKGASLYCADFYLSKPDSATDFKGADLTGTLLLLDGEKVQ
ncbi:MAG: pentapeptide repeat-containing protein [Deltaproteobacteria bacterium]|jgi:uncharacterized protein YjbI with pentapeptide repeats|nr:pentapeptide repeat-containing protein [Deltaproteobacteria bacterium]